MTLMIGSGRVSGPVSIARGSKLVSIDKVKHEGSIRCERIPIITDDSDPAAEVADHRVPIAKSTIMSIQACNHGPHHPSSGSDLHMTIASLHITVKER